MSWTVAEEDWLAEPTVVPRSGAIDAVDAQVLSAMIPRHRQAPVVSVPVESLPPPPTSAAFEPHERPSYESGAFVADPPAADPAAAEFSEPAREAAAPEAAAPEAAAPEAAAPEAAVPEAAAREAAAPAPALEPPPVDPAEPAEFHIPTLAFGVPEPERQMPAPTVAPLASEQPAGLVIPTLSRMKWVPAPVSPAEATAIFGASVDDDDDAAAVPAAHEAGQPEVLEQVDSAELELVASEDGPGPQERQDEAPELEFVIPTLARPDVRPDQSDRLDISLDSTGGRDEMVMPMLMRAQPAAPGSAEPPPEVEHTPPPQAEPESSESSADAREPDAPVVEHIDDVEDLEEVEAIESLDVADLVETETEAETKAEAEPAAVEPDAKPRVQPPDTKPQQKRRKAWYDDVFAEHFSFLLPVTWDETASRDAQFIHEQLGLREGGSVLDVGCGDGLHAIALAKLGLNVTGVDNSLAMLLAAAQHKEAAGVDDQRVTFMHGDMRRLPRDREFDAVICVGTTFGYFEEEQNRQCLQEMVDRLAVGGRLLLQVFNRDFVAPHLPSRSWWQGRRCMVIDEAEMNFFANRLRVHRTIIFDDGRQYEHFMFMRAYTVQDLGKAMSSFGLRVVEVSGSRDTRARFYGSTSPDIWIVAERK